MNPYAGLMQAATQQQGGQNPLMRKVHHEENPMFGQLEAKIKEVDETLDGLPMGAPEYDELLAIRNALSQKRANIMAAHEGLAGRQRGLEAKRKGYEILGDPGLEALERGIIPGRR